MAQKSAEIARIAQLWCPETTKLFELDDYHDLRGRRIRDRVASTREDTTDTVCSSPELAIRCQLIYPLILSESLRDE